MQGPAVSRQNVEEEEEEASDSTDRDQDLEIASAFRPMSPLPKATLEEPAVDLLLDAIPEDKTHCERVVNHLLAPMSGFCDSSECSMESDDLMSDMLCTPASPSTVTTNVTSGSLSPRHIGRKQKSSAHFHSSCSVLKLDSV